VPASHFDVVVIGWPGIDGLIKDGKVIADTRTNLVRSGIGVEVRADAPKPDISSVEAFKRALLSARSIGYLKVGSGIYLAALLDRLGIAEAIASKVTRPDTDIVSELVAKGEIELRMVVGHQVAGDGALPAKRPLLTVHCAGCRYLLALRLVRDFPASAFSRSRRASCERGAKSGAPATPTSDSLPWRTGTQREVAQ